MIARRDPAEEYMSREPAEKEARRAAAAARALAEAEARRAAAASLDRPPEEGGRDGPEPVRYGDWERRGLAVDF
jgi:hypothetical protein